MVNGSLYNFSRDVGSNVPVNSCNNARLTYEDKGDLTARRFFWGTVGDNITITIENGVTINGKLDMPIHPPSSVGGSGIWTAKILGMLGHTTNEGISTKRMNVLEYSNKKLNRGATRDRTWVSGMLHNIKILSDNHYTIAPHAKGCAQVFINKESTLRIQIV